MKCNIMKILLVSLGLIISSNVLALSLHQAVVDDDIELVKSQLQNGVDINQLWSSEEGFRTALHLAVQKNRQAIVQLLVEQGASVDIRDNSNYTPLHDAAWNGSLNMVKLLLNSGADIGAISYSGHTPLSCARIRNQVEVIQFIEGALQSASY